MSDSDSGTPIQIFAEAAVVPKLINFGAYTRQVSLRNIGTEALWFSFDNTTWFDVACGTSWDDRVRVNKMWVRTQTGWTSFVFNGLRVNPVAG